MVVLLIAGLLKWLHDLANNAGKSIVVCNSNDTEVQTLVNAINNKLGNYENTLSLSNPSYLKQGNDTEVAALSCGYECWKYCCINYL